MTEQEFYTQLDHLRQKYFEAEEKAFKYENAFRTLVEVLNEGNKKKNNRTT
jgi:hypothetical protein